MNLNKFARYCRRSYNNMLGKGMMVTCMVMFTFAVQAQDEMPPDFLRSTGKIYVVAAVTLVILLSIFAYLIILDRKISRIEKRHKNE